MQIFAFSKRFPWMFRKRKKREMCEGFVALRVFLVYCESDLERFTPLYVIGHAIRNSMDNLCFNR